MPHDRGAELDDDYVIGPVSIRSGGRRLTEYLRGEPHQLQAIRWFETWPAIAEGPWPGNSSLRAAAMRRSDGSPTKTAT